MAKIKVTTPNASKDVEQLEFVCIAGKRVKEYTTILANCFL